MTPSTANELTAMTKNGVATAVTYDAWGRTVTKARNGDNTLYSYLYGGRLVHVDLPGTEVDYDYNGLGQRIVRIEDGDQQETHYYWNGYSVVNEYDWSGAEWGRHYVGGLGEINWNGAYSYYFTDHLGSTLALYDGAKARTGGIEYTAYGAPTFSEGAAGATTRRYTGHDYDSLTGDYFAPYRYYSPSTHRWLTRDPMGMVDGPNVYGYVGGNPVRNVDAMGLQWGPDDMQDYPTPCAQTIERLRRDLLGMQGENRWRHCCASCELKKGCGSLVSSLAGLAKEMYDLLQCALGNQAHCESAFQPEDFEDNEHGRSCPDDDSCEDRCNKLRGVPDSPPGPFRDGLPPPTPYIPPT